MEHGIQIGIDIGGTFVDVVVKEADGHWIAKAPSTPRQPAEGVLRLLEQLVRSGRLDPRRVTRILHGSTVATNALLEGKWGRVALITTRGFRDVLEIGRQNRPHLYELEIVRPRPIVPRDLRFEVSERVTADGLVETPLAIDELRALVPALRSADLDAVAVVFLFSYLRPEHERRVREILLPELGIPIVLSSDVLPEFREFERTSTTVISACLRPVVGRYLEELERGAGRLGFPDRWQVMQSSGAVMSADAAGEKPDRLLLSGPAGGVEGARAVGRSVGETDLITMDMGGTSCDVSMVLDGRADWTGSGEVGGHPVATPMVAIHTIGAGGGSIAWLDSGGALRVGPQSAGADPGPACYGRGGTLPTVTDAHLVLGHLGSGRPFGGLRLLDSESSRRAIEEAVAGPLGMSCEDAALGILEVADAAMDRAIRVVSVERGLDPRRYALLAFGGAGPLHAVSIARRLGIPRVLIPQMAGVLSAYGLLVAEAGRDLSRSLLQPLATLDATELAAHFASLEEEGLEKLGAEGLNVAEASTRWSVDLRYIGQSHELNVPIRGDGSRRELSPGTLEADFHALHRERYGHAAPGEPTEVVTVRVHASVASESGTAEVATGESAPAPATYGEVWFDATGPQATQIVDRRCVLPGGEVSGPMILLAEDSTLLIPPGVVGRKTDRGDLLLLLGAAE
jgi:N-methylhydantoinase A